MMCISGVSLKYIIPAILAFVLMQNNNRFVSVGIFCRIITDIKSLFRRSWIEHISSLYRRYIEVISRKYRKRPLTVEEKLLKCLFVVSLFYFQDFATIRFLGMVKRKEQSSIKSDHTKIILTYARMLLNRFYKPRNTSLLFDQF